MFRNFIRRFLKDKFFVLEAKTKGAMGSEYLSCALLASSKKDAIVEAEEYIKSRAFFGGEWEYTIRNSSIFERLY